MFFPSFNIPVPGLIVKDLSLFSIHLTGLLILNDASEEKLDPSKSTIASLGGDRKISWNNYFWFKVICFFFL
ncbi:MAG: hypothetical protein CM15mP122_4570 [Bacteroidota bacterium]|nr:MAG: hypothetical protein CM15mP122_4570 [Bacteroidota bacterium]